MTPKKTLRQREKELKRLGIKGLYKGRELTFDEYLALMLEEAKREQRRRYGLAA